MDSTSRITGTTLLGLFMLGVMACLGVWFLWTCLKRSDEPGKLVVKWLLSVVLFWLIFKSVSLGPFAAPAVAIIGIILGLFWAPHLAGLLAGALTSPYDGGTQELEPQPLYSIAEARRKQGRYPEALAEIRQQLARFPNDFKGHMLQSEIQAEDLKDLDAALETIEAFVAQEGHAPKNVSYALKRAADWHLKFGHDRECAHRTLQRIVDLYPDTEEAQLAQQRIAHLATDEVLADQQEPHRIALRTFEDNIGLKGSAVSVRPPDLEPGQQAAEYVKHLEAYPLDNEVREKLASIYADHFHRLDLASAQLEQLIQTPHQLPKQIVHWLNLLADYQIKLAGDATLARQTLQRIVDLFPNRAAADNALNRMARLNLELKVRQQSHAIQLGAHDRGHGANSS